MGAFARGKGPRGPEGLAAGVRDRIAAAVRAPGWRRTLLLRRLLAAALVVLAAVLALRPGPGPAEQASVVVAARDLAPGTTVRPADVALRQLPRGSTADGTATAVAQVAGRVLAGAARAGEPITDVRLAGPELAELTTGRPDAASVPIRLADPDVAALLRPGSRVDVITSGARRDEPVVLAAGATVLAVVAADDRSRQGRLVVVALPPDAARRVAGASLGQPITLTLR